MLWADVLLPHRLCSIVKAQNKPRTLGFLQMERSTKFSLLGSNNRIFKVLNPGINFSLAMKILDEVLFKDNDDWLKNMFLDGGWISCVK